MTAPSTIISDPEVLTVSVPLLTAITVATVAILAAAILIIIVIQ